MKEPRIIEFLEQISKFTEKDKKLILESSEFRTMRRGEFLLEFNEVCKDVHFIQKGVVRFYIMSDQGDELTTAFLSEGDVATRIESFLREIPSNGYLQCETYCEFISISKDNWVQLCEKVKDFGYTMGQLATISIARKMELQRRLLTNDARDSYLNFIRFHEDIINRVSSKHIASYLGITPSSLSRIKRELTEK